jgi:hypothetical protein
VVLVVPAAAEVAAAQPLRRFAMPRADLTAHTSAHHATYGGALHVGIKLTHNP